MLPKAVVEILANSPTFAFGNFQHLFFQFDVLEFLLFAFGDVGADRDVLDWFSVQIQEGKYRRIDPVDAPVFGAVANLPFPGLPF